MGLVQNITPEIWLNLLMTCIGSAGTVLVFFFKKVFSKRKEKVDLVAVELANVEKAISIYRGIAEDLQTKITALEARLTMVHRQNTQLIAENADLKRQMLQLERKLDTYNNK